jgi:hypothetical protein
VASKCTYIVCATYLERKVVDNGNGILMASLILVP